MVDFVVATGVADVRRLPDDSSELVTQALLNMPVYAGKLQGEWAEVKLVDYLCWMRLSDLATPITKGFCKVGEDCGTPVPLIAVITATHTALRRWAMPISRRACPCWISRIPHVCRWRCP